MVMPYPRSMRRKRSPFLLAVAMSFSLAACGSGSRETRSCADSKPLGDGLSVAVEVAVRSKAGVSMIGLVDVNGGIYSAPAKEIEGGDAPLYGAVTQLSDGDYVGKVSRNGDKLTMELEGRSMPLKGPEACDD